jgi:prepilin peptidase CpaA
LFSKTPLSLVAGAVFTALLVWAAFGDLRSRRIPNRLVLAIAVLGLIYSTETRGLPGLANGFGGVGTGLVCWLPFYALGWLGAGDVKMFAASGAWLGPMKTLEGSLLAALIGAVLALLWMLKVRGIRNSLQTLTIATGSPGMLSRSGKKGDSPSDTLPYGIAMAAGALLAAWFPVFPLL